MEWRGTRCRQRAAATRMPAKPDAQSLSSRQTFEIAFAFATELFPRRDMHCGTGRPPLDSNTERSLDVEDCVPRQWRLNQALAPVQSDCSHIVRKSNCSP